MIRSNLGYNEDIEKTLKIRKLSEKIEFIPAIDLKQQGSHTNRDGGNKRHPKEKGEYIL